MLRLCGKMEKRKEKLSEMKRRKIERGEVVVLKEMHVMFVLSV